MTMLEKIIYIADYIEPGRRELPNMADVRRLAFQNIDECLYRILKDSLVYLNSRKIAVDPMTQKRMIIIKRKWERRIKYGSGKGNGKNRI